MKETIVTIIQLILSLILIVLVLLQQKGVGLSGVFGGSSNIYSTKRGVDKFLFTATIVIAIIFFAFSLARLIIVA